MNYRIIGDSCCDYPDDGRDMSWLLRVPLTIELGEKRYTDDKDFDCIKFLEEMNASPEAPKSACPAAGEYLEFYDINADEIYVVTLSEKLSGSYNSAQNAAELFKEENKVKKIHVFNSSSASAGQIRICYKIKELADSGLPFEDVVEKTEEFIDQMTTLFVLETLDVFRKNGRLNHLQAILTSALRLKMVMGAEPDGTVGVRAKALTTESAISKMVNIIKTTCEKIDFSNMILVISHCNCFERVMRVKELIMSAVNFKDIIICKTGGISTMYANAGGIILGF